MDAAPPVLACLGLFGMSLLIARYRGASVQTPAIGTVAGLVGTCLGIAAVSFLGLETSLWALIGLVIGLVAFITWRRVHRMRGTQPDRSPFDLS